MIIIIIWRQPHLSWSCNVVMQDKGVEQEDKLRLANLRLAHQRKFYRENTEDTHVQQHQWMYLT